jgi:hypothetical protein
MSYLNVPKLVYVSQLIHSSSINIVSLPEQQKQLSHLQFKWNHKDR